MAKTKKINQAKGSTDSITKTATNDTKIFHTLTTTTKKDIQEAIKSVKPVVEENKTVAPDATDSKPVAPTTKVTIKDFGGKTNLANKAAVKKGKGYEKKRQNKKDEKPRNLRGAGVSHIKSKQRSLERSINYLDAKLFDNPSDSQLLEKLNAAKKALEELSSAAEQAVVTKQKATELDTHHRRTAMKYDRDRLREKATKLRQQLELMMVGVDVTEEEIALRNELADLQEKRLYVSHFPATLPYIRIVNTKDLTEAEVEKQKEIMQNIITTQRYVRPTYRMSLDWTYNGAEDTAKIAENKENQMSDNENGDDLDLAKFALSDDDAEDDSDEGYDSVWGGGSAKNKSRFTNEADDDIERNIHKDILRSQRRNANQGDDQNHEYKLMHQYKKELKSFKGQSTGNTNPKYQKHATKVAYKEQQRVRKSTDDSDYWGNAPEDKSNNTKHNNNSGNRNNFTKKGGQNQYRR